MNNVEISVMDRVIISRTRYDKEIGSVLGFTPDGKILIRDSSGQVVTVTSEQIIKKF